MESHLQLGVERRREQVVVIGLDGSPSSGVRYTGKAKDWGGRPHFEDGDYEVVEGMGVWMEELKRGLEARGVPVSVRRSRGRDAGAACGQLALKRPGETPGA